MSIRHRFVFAGVTMLGLLLGAAVASAHVVMKPYQANVGQFVSFSVGVPVEKDMLTVGLRLVMPPGLHEVTPNVKAGWKISVTKEAGEVTEIRWAGGSIPAGQRDDFVFSAQVPANATVLPWKAYQTYQDGSVVSWDHDPKTIQPEDQSGHADFSATGPYSETSVISDIGTVAPAAPLQRSNDMTARLLGAVALTFSLWALRPRRHRAY